MVNHVACWDNLRVMSTSYIILYLSNNFLKIHAVLRATYEFDKVLKCHLLMRHYIHDLMGLVM